MSDFDDDLDKDLKFVNENMKFQKTIFSHLRAGKLLEL
jgi:hypothetical protein